MDTSVRNERKLSRNGHRDMETTETIETIVVAIESAEALETEEIGNRVIDHSSANESNV